MGAARWWGPPFISCVPTRLVPTVRVLAVTHVTGRSTAGALEGVVRDALQRRAGKDAELAAIVTERQELR